MKKINDKRCIQNSNWVEECTIKCGYHKHNNEEIHFTNIHKRDSVFRIACRWLSELLDKEYNSVRKDMKINILGINRSFLDKSFFCKEKSDISMNMYNRFFRSNIKYGIKTFYDNNVIIDNIYHDYSSQGDTHEYFSWHPIYSLSKEGINFNCSKIKFINSNHNDSNKPLSHFIQLIDCILGATYTCLHNPTKIEKKKVVAKNYYNVLSTIMGKMPGKAYKNSTYYRCNHISFFPKNKLSYAATIDGKDTAFKDKNNYYYDRDIPLNNIPTTESLDVYL